MAMNKNKVTLKIKIIKFKQISKRTIHRAQ